MSFQIWWKCLRVICILIGLFTISTLPTAVGQDSSLEHPWRLLKEHRAPILELSSDQAALKFNQSFMPKPRQAQHLRTRRKPSRNQDTSNPVSQEMQATITTFWAAMATIGYIQKLRAIPEEPLNNHFFSGNLPLDGQRKWILSKPSLEKFQHLMKIQQKLSRSLPQDPEALPPANDYPQFAYFHDQSNSTPDRPSWTNTLSNLGFEGIEARLHEYWQQKDQQSTLHTAASDSQKQAYIQQYVASRLLPMFHAYLLAQAIQVEAQAYDVAWESWHRIQQWQQEEQVNRARARLCGSWKWIIHNHQNHGDHKTTMTFTPPGFATPPQVQPTIILIHGDTVYLKWTFPQGIQEDSLLLSNRDTRLEGTFTNSLGPHGSISGQRLSPCQN